MRVSARLRACVDVRIFPTTASIEEVWWAADVWKLQSLSLMEI